MVKENIKPFGLLVSIMLLTYIVHQAVFKMLGFNTAAFNYSLNELYLFFSLFSIVIFGILIKVKERDLDLVGNVFLLLTSVKMIVSYVFGRPIIKQENLDNSTEKWNFFTLFMIFLLLETIFTIYLLNAKNTKKEE